MNERKNTLGTDGKMDQAEERTCELRDRTSKSSVGEEGTKAVALLTIPSKTSPVVFRACFKAVVAP